MHAWFVDCSCVNIHACTSALTFLSLFSNIVGRAFINNFMFITLTPNSLWNRQHVSTYIIHTYIHTYIQAYILAYILAYIQAYILTYI